MIMTKQVYPLLFKISTFERDDMMTSFDNKVLRKITQKEFIEYIVPSMDD